MLVVRGANCSVLGSKRVHGTRGVNRVRFTGRVHGRPLAPGQYTIDLVVVRGSTKMRFGAIALEVVPPGSRLTKAQRTEPLVSDCSIAINSPTLPVAFASTAGPLAASRASFSIAGPGASERRTKTGVLGVSLKPPRLPLPVVDGAPMWLGVLLLVLFALGVAGLAVYVVRWRRGSWNP